VIVLVILLIVWCRKDRESYRVIDNNANIIAQLRGVLNPVRPSDVQILGLNDPQIPLGGAIYIGPNGLITRVLPYDAKGVIAAIQAGTAE
jgi:hypothetical protein